MVYNHTLESSRLLMRTVTLADCTEYYIQWMNDEETNQYMETRWSPQNRESIVSFIETMRCSSDCYLFAIIEKKANKHIGNIKIGPIHQRYRFADISYFIGAKKYRRSGLAKEAVRRICEFGFQELHLHRIQAGVIDGNDASASVLTACGFVLEGRLADKFIVRGEYKDHLIFGRINPQE